MNRMPFALAPPEARPAEDGWASELPAEVRILLVLVEFMLQPPAMGIGSIIPFDPANASNRLGKNRIFFLWVRQEEK
jgi:hypothetical protein